MDNLKISSFPYPIADTEEHPKITHFKGKLELEFTDYTATKRQILFDDVAFFSVSSIDADSRSLLDDQAYSVENSSQIKRLAIVGDIDDASDFKHLIVCFNESGQFLEIIYRNMITGAG